MNPAELRAPFIRALLMSLTVHRRRAGGADLRRAAAIAPAELTIRAASDLVIDRLLDRCALDT